MFRSSAPATWRQTPNGNYWRHVEDGDGVTVFWSERRDAWCWVFDDDYDDASFDSAEEAMKDAEKALEL